MLSPGEFFTVCCLGAKAALMAQAVDTDALRLRPAPITVRVGTVGNTGRQLPVLLATSGRLLTEGDWRGCLLAGCEDPRTVQAATDGVASTFTTRRAACHRDDQSGKGGARPSDTSMGGLICTHLGGEQTTPLLRYSVGMWTR